MYKIINKFLSLSQVLSQIQLSKINFSYIVTGSQNNSEILTNDITK